LKNKLLPVFFYYESEEKYELKTVDKVPMYILVCLEVWLKHWWHMT